MIPLYIVQTKHIDPFNDGGPSKRLDEAINTFLETIDGTDLIDIKYQMVYTPTQDRGWGLRTDQICTALIIYKEWVES